MRHRRLLSVLLLFLIVFLFLPKAWAKTDEAQSYVVLIGIDQYEDSSILPRTHAEGDVKALYDVLVSPANKSLYKADHVKLLLGGSDSSRPYEKATKDNILKAIKWAFSSAKEEDTILLCWLGQGGPSGTSTCYFAKDSTLVNRSKDAVTSAEIEQEFKTIKSNRVLLLLDVHFKGFQSTEKIDTFSLDNRFREYSNIDEDSDDSTLTKPFMLMAANSGLEPSIEMENHSLFMQLILEGMKGKADRFGKEADGIISVDELAEFVGEELVKKATSMNKRSQFPLIRGRSTHFPVAFNPAALESVEKRLQSFKALVAKHQLSKELQEEGNKLLGQMPRYEAQRLLRQKYVELIDEKINLKDFLAFREKNIASAAYSREKAEAFAERVLKVAGYTRDDYVKKVNLSEMVGHAVRGLYRIADEKIPKELQEELNDFKGNDEDKARDILITARMNLGQRDSLDKSKDLDAALAVMLHSLDPHSTYVDPETKRQFEISTQQQFIGVGIQIVKDVETDYIRVTTPLRGSPAYKAGIQTDDLLISVTNYTDKDGKALDQPVTTSTKGMSSTDVVKLILGKRNTKVTLTFEREMEDGTKKEISFDLRRNLVTAETVFGVRRLEDDSWDFMLDKENKIGYVRLSQFALNTERDLKKAVRELTEQGMKGLIIDLRFNPGGYLDAAVTISDMFIEDGSIVTIRPRDTNRERVFKATGRGTLTNFPMVILVNGGSASASEIVSGCLQDQQRAIVMGERSFGKGSVQHIRQIDIGDGPADLKLTTASFWRPNGKNLHRFPTSKETDDWGVSPLPEHLIKLDPSERDQLRDYLRGIEILPRKDGVQVKHSDRVDKSFVDRQLNKALDWVRKETTSVSKKNGKG